MKRAGMKLAGVAGMMLFLALAAPSSSQAAIVYWSFNTNLGPDPLAPNVGTGTMSVVLTGFGFLFVTLNDDGTAVNALPGYLPGDSLTDVDVGSAFSTMTITMSNLNFTGQSNINLSFATRSTAVFDLGEYMEVAYDIGSGFTGAQTLVLPDASWAARSVDFGSVLDNLPNATIRITLFGFVDVLEIAEFDNIMVVPEPSTWALLLLGLGSLGLVARRRSSKA